MKLTDEQIIEIAKATESAEPGSDGYILPVTFARAIESAVLLAAHPAAPSEPQPATQQATAGGSVTGWIDPHERVPEVGQECIVWKREAAPGFGPYAAIDTWDEQREAPVSWSSATVPIGPGWDGSDDFEDVMYWMPLPPPPGDSTPSAAPSVQPQPAVPPADLQTVQAMREVLSDVDPVVLQCWRLQGRKVGAMWRESQAAVIELQEQLDDARMQRTAAAAAPAPAIQADKYDDVLLPFLTLMRRELHANSDKGDRPGWLRMDANTALLEVYWHVAKLSTAVKKNDGPAIMEHSADVANMAMMVLDVCGGLALVEAAAQEAAPTQPEGNEENRNG